MSPPWNDNLLPAIAHPQALACSATCMTVLEHTKGEETT